MGIPETEMYSKKKWQENTQIPPKTHNTNPFELEVLLWQW